ncbi:hypothetical protein KC345_g187 [Hortaea werneckii]|nr:hypothetical protein KC345_g187 [Hortaea werneckii]
MWLPYLNTLSSSPDRPLPSKKTSRKASVETLDLIWTELVRFDEDTHPTLPSEPICALGARDLDKAVPELCVRPLSDAAIVVREARFVPGRCSVYTEPQLAIQTEVVVAMRTIVARSLGTFNQAALSTVVRLKPAHCSWVTLSEKWLALNFSTALCVVSVFSSNTHGDQIFLTLRTCCLYGRLSWYTRGNLYIQRLLAQKKKAAAARPARWWCGASQR